MKRTYRNYFRLMLAVLLLFLTAIGCTGLVSLDLPPMESVDPEKDWITLGRNNQHQHYSPVNINPPLREVWKKQVKSVIVDHPLALGDFIVAPTESGQLYLIDYESGEGIGSGKLAPAMEGAPTIHNNILYTGTVLGERTLMGFDLRNASRSLNEKYPYISTSPLIEDQKIFFGTSRGAFFAASLGTGGEIWRFEADSPIRGSAALQGDQIFFADVKGTVYALDSASGGELWRQQLNGHVYAHPVADDSTIYIGTASGYLYCLQQADGAILWQNRYQGAIYGGVALYQNIVYFGNNNHEVVAVHRRTGEEIWKFLTKGIVNTVPLPSPDYLYVASWDRNLYVLNRFSGKEIFSYALRRPPKSSPIIYRDYLLIHSSNHQLIALAHQSPEAPEEDKD